MEKKKYKYIIIGGGIAGGEAAAGIRELDEEGSILLISSEMHRPYERPPLSKSYLVDGEGLEEDVYLEGEDFYEDNQVDIAEGSPVVSIDRETRQVNLADKRAFNYERLLLATGSRADRLPLQDAGLANIFTLRTIEDSQAIRAAAKSAERAVVIGGSFIGAETASSLTQLGLEVSMVFPESQMLDKVAPPDLGAFLLAKYQDRGVKVHWRRKPAEFSGDDRVQQVILENGDRLETDMVVMGVGVKPNTNIAEKAGLEMDADGAVIVDEMLRTSDPDIFAAGDIAAWPDPTFDRRMRVEHWDVAKNQGRIAGRNMAGAEEAYEEVPYFFSDLFDLSFEVWGHLEGWDHALRRGEFEDPDGFAYFFFRNKRLTGILDAGRPETEREAMPKLVEQRPFLDEISANITDPAMDLMEQVPA